MNFRKFLGVIFIFSIIACPAFSQSLFLDGDTIKVFDDIPSKIMFPGIVKDYKLLGNKSDYIISCKKVVNKSAMTITVGADNPSQSCQLLVTEGDSVNQRQHRFLIYHAKQYDDPGEAINDFSSLKTMLAFKKLDDERKNKSTPVASSGDAETDAASQAKNNETANNNVIWLGSQPVLKSDMNDMVMKKIHNLEYVLNALGNKTDAMDKIVPTGMALFNDDNTKIVEISGKAGVHQSHIEQYFQNLYRLKYFGISINFSELQFISGIKKNPDGTYTGTCTLQQTFRGMGKDNTIKYEDVQTKNIEFIIKITQELKNGVTKNVITVFLGNIGIQENK